VAPVFAGDELFGFVANIAHHADRTGERIRNIWDEGLRIPPIRLIERGVMREDVLELLLANFALPDERRGDFRAQLAVNRLGERRLGELIERSRLTTVRATCDELLDYGERKIRAAIAAVPDGVYRFTDAMDDDGVSAEPIPIVVTITVAGDSTHVLTDPDGGFADGGTVLLSAGDEPRGAAAPVPSRRRGRAAHRDGRRRHRHQPWLAEFMR